MQLSLIQNNIHEIRGRKVMLDFDLAEMYEVETRILKQAVKRNRSRFLVDSMLQLSEQEVQTVVSQSVIPSKLDSGLPFAFTEQGVVMLPGVLISEKAMGVNIAVIRSFVLARQHTSNGKELQDKLLEPEKKYNKNFREIYRPLLF